MSRFIRRGSGRDAKATNCVLGVALRKSPVTLPDVVARTQSHSTFYLIYEIGAATAVAVQPVHVVGRPTRIAHEVPGTTNVALNRVDARSPRAHAYVFSGRPSEARGPASATQSAANASAMSSLVSRSTSGSSTLRIHGRCYDSARRGCPPKPMTRELGTKTLAPSSLVMGLGRLSCDGRVTGARGSRTEPIRSPGGCVRW